MTEANDKRSSLESARPRVLVAEDDLEMRRLVADALRGERYDVVEIADGVEFGSFFVDKPRVDLVVTDVRMPGGNGLDLVEALRKRLHDVPVIVMTGFGDTTTRTRAESLGAKLLDKPFRMAALRDLARRLLTKSAD